MGGVTSGSKSGVSSSATSSGGGGVPSDVISSATYGGVLETFLFQIFSLNIFQLFFQGG